MHYWHFGSCSATGDVAKPPWEGSGSFSVAPELPDVAKPPWAGSRGEVGSGIVMVSPRPLPNGVPRV